MKNLIFSPFPELKTKRLLLRKLSALDVENLFMLRSNEDVNRFLQRKRSNSKSDAKEFIIRINHEIETGNCIYWAITLENSPDLVGTICFFNFSKSNKRVELGYELLPEFQGFGFMNEAMGKVIEFGFRNFGFQWMDAYSHKNNFPSISLLEKNKFERNRDPRKIGNEDFLLFSKINTFNKPKLLINDK